MPLGAALFPPESHHLRSHPRHASGIRRDPPSIVLLHHGRVGVPHLLQMVISINDHPQIREMFANLRLKEVPLRHMVGGQGGKQANELIYFNW